MKALSLTLPKPKSDPLLIAIPSILTFLGLIYIYSATFTQGRGHLLNLSPFVRNQIAWFIIAYLAYQLASRVKFVITFDTWYLLYIPIVILLLIVLLFGVEVFGARRWLAIGSFTFQPAEFAKLVYILLLAQFLSGKTLSYRNFVYSFFITLSLLILISLEPDLGTSIVFIAIFSAMLLIVKGGGRYFLILAVIVTLLSLFSYFFVLKDYQKKRIQSFMFPEQHKLEAGYQAYQARIAIGSGGIMGKGLLRGTQTQGRYIPAVHTDFIFAVIGEETGLMGALLVLVLLGMLLMRILQIARKAPTEGELLIGYGVFVMILVHTVVNVSVNLGLLPVTGLPLPFLSYGGSSLINLFLAIGMIQSIYKNVTVSYHLKA